MTDRKIPLKVEYFLERGFEVGEEDSLIERFVKPQENMIRCLEYLREMTWSRKPQRRNRRREVVIYGHPSNPVYRVTEKEFNPSGKLHNQRIVRYFQKELLEEIAAKTKSIS